VASADSAPAPQIAARRAASPSAMAATNKCLAQINKSRGVAEATKKREKSTNADPLRDETDN
jgi:hypothetical protein